MACPMLQSMSAKLTIIFLSGLGKLLSYNPETDEEKIKEAMLALTKNFKEAQEEIIELARKNERDFDQKVLNQTSSEQDLLVVCIKSKFCAQLTKNCKHKNLVSRLFFLSMILYVGDTYVDDFFGAVVLEGGDEQSKST